MVLDAVSQHTGGVLSIESFRNKIDEQFTVSPGDAAGEMNEVIFAEGLSALHPLLSLKAGERLIIAEALKRADGNQTIAAQLLGMSRNALNKRLSRSRTSSDDI